MHNGRAQFTPVRMAVHTMNDDLIPAIQQGDAARVAELLDADPSLLGARANGVSAVVLAIYYRHPDIAQLFLERGAPLTFAEACAVGDEPRALELLAQDPSSLERRSDDGFPPLGYAIFF